MSSKLEAFLETFGPLSPENRAVLNGVLEIERFDRGDLLWRAGEKCDRIYFINDGLVRLYFYDEKGVEITVHFVGKQYFIADPDALRTGAPSSVSASVEMPTEVVMLNRPALQRLEQNFFDWNALLAKITEKSLFEKVILRNRLFQAAGRERFEIFLTEFPGVANHVKAADVASFLGISQYTLSHLKKEMVKTDGAPPGGNRQS